MCPPSQFDPDTLRSPWPWLFALWFVLLVLSGASLASCAPSHHRDFQECRDKRTGWTGREGSSNGYYVMVTDKDGWERSYSWTDVECRPVAQ